MSWSIEDLKKHPKRDSLLGRGLGQLAGPVPKPAPPPAPVNSSPAPAGSNAFHFLLPFAFPQSVTIKDQHRFTVDGIPVAKPRMTRRDQWQKRPCVLRYREYCDRLRHRAGELAPGAIAILFHAWIPMPAGWSKKKKQEMDGRMMRSTPDTDNIAKSINDALLKQDSGIAGMIGWKFWCPEGRERTEIIVLYGDDHAQRH